MQSSFLDLASRGCPHLLQLGRATRQSSLPRCACFLGIMLFAATLLGSSAQNAAPHREFSAYVLMRMAKETSGVGARVSVKEDNVYLDYPDPKGRHVPFWFLSDGVIASVKYERSEEGSNGEVIHSEFYPGPGEPFSTGEPYSLGFFLRFRPSSVDRFCEEFRAYYLAFMQAAGWLPDEELKNLQKPESFRCEQTGHETVTLRDCLTYRVASGFSEYWVTLAFDPKLTAILKVQWGGGLILRLDAIKEGPQPASVFVPPLNHVVVVDPKRPRRIPKE